MNAMTSSGGAVRAVTDERDSDGLPVPGRERGRSSASRRRRRALPGCSCTARDGAQRVVCVLTGHGLKDPETALDQAGAVVAVRPRARRDRARGARVTLARRRLVRVPASSANLGPGFDVLAAALALHLELEVVETGDVRRRHRPRRPARPRQPRRPGVRAAAPRRRFRVPDQVGDPAQRRARVERGRDRRGADGRRPPVRARRRRPRLAAELEGHPDNVGAALEGGFVVCDGGAGPPVRAPTGLEAVLVVPDEGPPTEQARERALPATVPIGDAVFNIAHAAMLTLGLATGDWDLIAAGLHDRLHQPHRAHLYPRSADLLDARTASGRSGRRSPAPGRPCSCGPGTTRPGPWSSAPSARPPAGRP